MQGMTRKIKTKPGFSEVAFGTPMLAIPHGIYKSIDTKNK